MQGGVGPTLRIPPALFYLEQVQLEGEAGGFSACLHASHFQNVQHIL